MLLVGLVLRTDACHQGGFLHVDAVEQGEQRQAESGNLVRIKERIACPGNLFANFFGMSIGLFYKIAFLVSLPGLLIFPNDQGIATV